MKAVLRYPGAKNRIAGWICSHIPEHDVYLEPYAGSLAVLLNKEPCHIETVNDLNDEVVNYFRVLRDSPGKLQSLVSLTPYSRAEYEKAYEYTDNEIERAWRFCVRCWMGFGNSDVYRNGFKSGQQRNSPNPAKAWAGLPGIMEAASRRLKNVQIENLPAPELIRRYDTADVFMYIDPPYLQGTRKGYLYKYEMDDKGHEELMEAAAGHPGKVLISGYDNEMYNYYLSGWKKAYKNTRAENGLARTEVLWMNYSIGNEQMTLWTG